MSHDRRQSTDGIDTQKENQFEMFNCVDVWSCVTLYG